MSFREGFEKLKAHKHAWIIYSTLTIVLTVLLIFTGECFVVLLIPLLLFGIPYLFGVRRIKRFLIFGTLCIVAIAIIIGIVFTYAMYTEFGVQSGIEPRYGSAYTKTSKWGVEPLIGNTQTTYKYSIHLCGEQNATYKVYTYISPLPYVLINLNAYYTQFEKTGKESAKENFTKYLNEKKKEGALYVLEMPGVYEGRNNWSYQREIKFNESQYFYFVVIGDWFEGEVENTPLARGPFVTDKSKYIFGGYMIVLFLINYFILFGIVFFLIVMLYWWLQKGKKEREKLEAQLRELEEREKMEKMKVPTKGKKVVIEYECSKCGAAVTEKDVRCPKCGEIFEEEIEEKIEEKEKIERKKVKEDKKPKW